MRLLAGIVVWLSMAGSAWAAFPYEYDGTAPNDLDGKLEWMYAATPERANTLVTPTRASWAACAARSLVDAATRRSTTAWQTTTGRPDVTIAVLDSGIKWNDPARWTTCAPRPGSTAASCRPRTTLNGSAARGRRGLRAPTPTPDDANSDGVFNVLDYACDARVDSATRRRRRAADGHLLDPQDVLIAFTDGDGRRRQRLRRRHRRLGLPRRRQRPLRRRPVRPRHRRGAGLDGRGRQRRRRSAPARTACRSRCASATRSSPTSTASRRRSLYARRQRRAGRPGGARHAQQHRASPARPSSTPTTTA